MFVAVWQVIIFQKHQYLFKIFTIMAFLISSVKDVITQAKVINEKVHNIFWKSNML